MQIYLLLSTAKHRELKLELSKPPKTQYFLDLTCYLLYLPRKSDIFMKRRLYSDWLKHKSPK